MSPSKGKLIGVVSLLDLVTASEDTRIEEIMDENVISVKTKEDKETVAKTLAKYDLLALPVVDGENRIVGIVTVDDAIDVIQEETTEDIEIMAAILPTDKPYFKTGVILKPSSSAFHGFFCSWFQRHSQV